MLKVLSHKTEIEREREFMEHINSFKTANLHVNFQDEIAF